MFRAGVGLAAGADRALELGETLGDAEGVAGAVAGAVAGESTVVGATVTDRSDSLPEVSRTVPTVPPIASTTPIAAVAATPVGETLRVRACLPATGPVLSSTEQTGSDRSERSTSEVNVIMVVLPYL